MRRQIVITDILVADGSGGPLRRCDVLVDGDRIAEIRPATTIPTVGRTVARGAGLLLAPGFIDVHSHADNAPLLDPPDTSKILQGVTTEVVGNCGFSLAPRVANAALLDALLSRIFPPLLPRWGGSADLYRALDERGYVTNMAPLVGHHAIRIAAMGMTDSAPTAAQSATMRSHLAEAMDAGAFGLSTGLIYPPGLFSRTDELASLAAALPPLGVYATHLRGEGGRLLESVREAIAIGAQSRRRVQVSHLKAAGRPYWGSVAEALRLLDAARADGVDIHHDVYPYTASSTMVTALLPPWFQEGGNTAVLDRLADPATRRRVRDEIAAGPHGSWENMAWAAGWENIVLAATGSGRHEGWSFAELAAEWGCAPFDAMARVLTEERLTASMTVHQMSDDDLRAGLAHPHTMIGSDGLPPGTGGKPHPRTWGTFPRVLSRYSGAGGPLTVPEAVRRMTSLPAHAFRIPDRGVIAEGAVADLVAFDPASITDRATFADPVRQPAGIRWVMQGGQVVVRDGVFSGERAGRRLRPAGAAAPDDADQ